MDIIKSLFFLLDVLSGPALAITEILSPSIMWSSQRMNVDFVVVAVCQSLYSLLLFAKQRLWEVVSFICAIIRTYRRKPQLLKLHFLMFRAFLFGASIIDPSKLDLRHNLFSKINLNVFGNCRRHLIKIIQKDISYFSYFQIKFPQNSTNDCNQLIITLKLTSLHNQRGM